MLNCKCSASPPAERRRHKQRPEILQEGYLDRKFRSSFKGWSKKNYAVLIKYPGKPNPTYRIEFFKHPSSTHCSYSVDIGEVKGKKDQEKEECIVRAVEVKGKSFAFGFKDKRSDIIMCAESEIDRIRWIDALNDVAGGEIHGKGVVESRSRRSSSNADHVPRFQRDRLDFGLFTFRIRLPTVDAVVVLTCKRHVGAEEKKSASTLVENSGHVTTNINGETVPFDVFVMMRSINASDLKAALFDWLEYQLKRPQLIVAGAAISKESRTKTIEPATERPFGSTIGTPSPSSPKMDASLLEHAEIPPVPPRPEKVFDSKVLSDDEPRRARLRDGFNVYWERAPKLDRLRDIREIISAASDAYVLQDTSSMMSLLNEIVPLRRIWDLRGLVKDLSLVSSSYASSRLVCEITGSRTLLDMNNRKYTAYVMLCRTGELSWSVRRRYKEFFELHARVKRWLSEHERETAVNALPRLPKKTFSIGGKKMDNAFVSRRERALQRYVAGLLTLEWSTACIPILSFFGAMSTSRQETYEKNNTRPVVHASEVHKFAAPGDVLLFRTKSTLSNLQRMVTVSEWDHVGMITVRDDSSKLWLLEACGDRVVCLPLVPRLKAYAKEYAECIAVRRFEKPERTASMLGKLAAFTEEVNGKPYSCTPGKLLRRNSKGGDARTEDYFCSELVASALKTMGFLQRKKASSYFWPGSYNEGGEIERNLVDGVVLGKLFVVDCKFAEIGKAIRDSSF